MVLGDPLMSPSERAGRLEEFVELLDRVLTQPLTSHAGAHYRAIEAETTLPCVQQPRIPFVVAANGPRMMRLAVGFGAGWATTGAPEVPRGNTDDELWWRGIATVAARFEQVLAQTGRAPDSIDRMLSVDAAPTFSLVSLEKFRDTVGRARELGFTDVVVHWPVPGAPRYDAPESMVEALAAELDALHAA